MKSVDDPLALTVILTGATLMFFWGAVALDRRLPIERDGSWMGNAIIADHHVVELMVAFMVALSLLSAAALLVLLISGYRSIVIRVNHND